MPKLQQRPRFAASGMLVAFALICLLVILGIVVSTERHAVVGPPFVALARPLARSDVSDTGSLPPSTHAHKRTPTPQASVKVNDETATPKTVVTIQRTVRQSTFAPSQKRCHSTFVEQPEAKVRDHPGGTEDEALEERRLLASRNGLSAVDAVWRSRARPEMPRALSCVWHESVVHDVSAVCGSDDWDCLMRHTNSRTASNVCASHYDGAIIDMFRAHRNTLCDSASSSRLVCMQARTHENNAIDTSICHARSIAIDFDRITDGDFPWLSFARGSVRGTCKRADTDRWNFIHCQNDWMGLGFENSDAEPKCDVTIQEPTFFMTRSGDYSPFAMMHDWVNAVLHFASVPLFPSNTSVVVMDRMTVGFYTPVLQAIFSPRHKLQWFPDLRENFRGKIVCYSNAHFNIPARLSPLYNEDDCRGSQWLRLTSDLIVRAVNAHSTRPTPDAIVVTIIIRKNYGTGHAIGRRFANPKQLWEGVSHIAPDVVANALDFADFDFDQQVNISRSTDVLVGMHGAGLIQAAFLPTHAGVFEIFCPDRPSSNIRYRELSKRLDLEYESTSLGSDDNTVVVNDVVPQIKKLIDVVRLKKRGLPGR